MTTRTGLAAAHRFLLALAVAAAAAACVGHEPEGDQPSDAADEGPTSSGPTSFAVNYLKTPLFLCSAMVDDLRCENLDRPEKMRRGLPHQSGMFPKFSNVEAATQRITVQTTDIRSLTEPGRPVRVIVTDKSCGGGFCDPATNKHAGVNLAFRAAADADWVPLMPMDGAMWGLVSIDPATGVVDGEVTACGAERCERRTETISVAELAEVKAGPIELRLGIVPLRPITLVDKAERPFIGLFVD